MTVELAEEETSVGQPIVLRVKVLVPSWMPDPPVFPEFETPGVMVRLPERASGPVSETVDGETWSGVQRSYRLYPLVAGRVTIPAQTMTVTYADPGESDPLFAEVPVDAVSFDAVVPPGAEGLSPLIVAESFSLEQSVEMSEDVAVGDAVTRVLTATIDGTTPVLIPSLTPPPAAPSLRAYPSDPEVTETEDRGVLSGARSERTVYVAQGEGEAVLPGLELAWFNLDTGAVETVSVPEVALTVLPGAPTPAEQESARWLIFGYFLAALLCAAAIWGINRLYGPRLRAAWQARRAQHRASEGYAFRALRSAIAGQDLTAAAAAAGTWAAHFPRDASGPLAAALSEVSAKRYGPDPVQPSRADWNALDAAVYEIRRNAKAATRARAAASNLPGLNP
ncbi:MAG: hypothetical protein AAGF74_12075 [Pseudomonadota bacterium]